MHGFPHACGSLRGGDRLRNGLHPIVTTQRRPAANVEPASQSAAALVR